MPAASSLRLFGLDYSTHEIGGSLIVHADCFEWMSRIPEASVHAIVTGPALWREGIRF